MMNRRHTPSTLFVSSVSVGLKPHTGCSNITPFFRRNYSIPRPRTIPTSLTIRASSTTTANKIRIAVLVSGGGRSLKNLHERIQSRSLRNVEICTVLSSKSTAGAIDLANSFNLPVHVISSQDYKGKTAEYSDAITKVLDSYSPDLVVMAGWITFYQIPSHYASKVINIHPALTPSFSGKGYYGDRVHRAVVSHSIIHISTHTNPRTVRVWCKSERVHRTLRRQRIRPWTNNFTKGGARLRLR